MNENNRVLDGKEEIQRQRKIKNVKIKTYATTREVLQRWVNCFLLVGGSGKEEAGWSREKILEVKEEQKEE